MINYQEFSKIDLRVGKVLEAVEHPNADKLYVLKVDLGDKEIQLVAGIRSFYEKENLVGKFIVVVANLEPREVRGVESNGMLLAAKDQEALSVLTIDKDILPGSAVG